MDRKTCIAYLDGIAPGWSDSDDPRQFVKRIDPKHRQAAARAVFWLSQNPPKKHTPKKTKTAKKAG